MKIGIVLYPNCSIWSASGPYEMLKRANRAQQYYFGSQNGQKKFDVSFISAHKSITKGYFAGSLFVDSSISDKNTNYDLIIVPGFDLELELILKNSKNLAMWIKEKHSGGTTIVSFCTGSVILALSGIIGNRVATTHWLLKPYFENIFPDIPLDISQVVINHGDIIMSGSATSFQVLTLHLIEEYMGRRVAVGVSKLYLIDFYKDRPDSYMSLTQYQVIKDETIKKVVAHLESNTTKMLSLDDIAKIANLNKRTFIRRFKSVLDDTPLNYFQKMKVEKAKEMLENNNRTFEEIAFILGYEDVCSFRKIFTKHAGIPPMKYKARYQLV